MRKLATIRKVDDLIAIPKKDRIEIAVIGGWSCIVKKGEFEVGSLGVFFEIDSFLPYTEPYLFLGKPTEHQGKQGYRLKTMKMAGAISQGLMLPLDMFYEHKDVIQLKEGEDLTELLNVIKYDIELTQQGKGGPAVTGKPKGAFPSFLPKTDQERIQNLGHYFRLYKDVEFEETLKLDGSSCTMYKIAGDNISFMDFLTLGLWRKLFPAKPHFGVCSRNLELKRPRSGDKASNFWDAASKYNIEAELPKGYAVQGEVLAPNIQGNFEKVESVEYYIFNVYDIEAGMYLSPYHARAFVEQFMPSAQYVPVLHNNVPIFTVCDSFDSLQERVTGPSMNQPISEGRVYKSENGVTFKCISDEYLLKSGK